jgi:hypothetical protein
MQNKLKEFFSSSAGKVLAVLLIVFVGIAIGSIKKDTPQPVVQNVPEQSKQQPSEVTNDTTVVTEPVAVVKPTPVPQQKVAPKKSVTATPTPVVAPTPTPTPQSTPTPVVTPKDWHIVGTFNGTSNNNTESFGMKGTKYRFTTTCYPLDTSIPTSTVYGTIRSTAGFTSGYENFENGLECPIVAHISYVYAQNPGDWYLAMQSINAKYVVTVEDYY